MKTLKNYIPIVLGLFLSLFVCSCGGNDDDEPSSGSDDMVSQLVGTWVGGDTSFTLKSNGTGTYIYDGDTSTFKDWTLKSNGELSAVFTSGSPKDVGRRIHLVTITKFTGTSFVDASDGSKYYKR